MSPVALRGPIACMHRSLPWAAIAAVTLPVALSAQSGRYRDEVFPVVAVQPDIQYGSAVNQQTQVPEQLLLDLYQPAGDPATNRAALVVVHGGGFVGGDKARPWLIHLCEDFARRGYVAVSINYRLASSLVTPGYIRDASHDMKAAVRWLRANANTLHIDTSRIGCIGGSAGAITCLQTAYVTNGEGNSGNPGYSSAVGAVVDLWGALAPLGQLQAGEVPVQIIHGTLDPIVPYQAGLDLHARALAVGVPTELHPIVGAGHGPWSTYFQSFHVEAVGFLYEHLRLGERAGLAAQPGYASPGTLTLDTYGVAGDFYVIGMAPSTGSLPIPGIGTLCIGPPESIVVAVSGALAASPRLAAASWSLSLPPGLAGTTAYWQAIHLHATGSRWLTNCVETSF